MLELTNACKALPNFGTFQIVRLSLNTPLPTREHQSWRCRNRWAFMERQKPVLKEQMEDVKDWAIDCLKEPETGSREAERTQKTTLRIIELSSVLALPQPRYGATPRRHLGSVKVEEYEV